MGKKNKNKTKNGDKTTSSHIWCPQCLEGFLMVEIDTWINREYKLRVVNGKIRHDKKPLLQNQQVDFTLTCDSCAFKDSDFETKVELYQQLLPLVQDGWYTSDKAPTEPAANVSKNEEKKEEHILPKDNIAQLLIRQEAEDALTVSEPVS
jgi:hypothetical protein